MKAYEELTHRGRMRRTRRIALEALDAYGLTGARLRLIVDTGNITYRVKAENPPVVEEKNDLYEDACYLLRLHQPGYQKGEYVDSEMEWLTALCEAKLPVPMPMLTLDGEKSVKVTAPGVPKARRCSFLRWVKGRMAKKLVRPWHMKAIGGLIARLHNHSSSWSPPPGFVRRHYDRNGFWGDDTGTGYSSGVVWPKISRRYFDAFREVTARAERVMDDWGKGPEVYGLIHADLGTEANVLFHAGEARAIDFDDSGYGYWAYDLAVPMCDWEGEEEWPAFREALLEGYSEIRSIPGYQLEQLELFQASFRAMEVFWGTACMIHNPDSAYWKERMEEALVHMERYLKRNPPH